MILKYKGSGTIKSQPGFEADKTKIISKMIIQLHELDIRTELVENKIILYLEDFFESSYRGK